MTVLVTGGAGYIGSHFVKYLIEKNFKVIVLDNLSRGYKQAVHSKAIFENADLLNYSALPEILNKYKPEAVVHFAAFAYVGESVEKPDLYYQNNVVGSFNLIKASAEHGIKKFVFSSTCSIYGNPTKVPISEDQLSNPINPYANTKLVIEMMLKDFDISFGMKSVALRYFNAAGSDLDGEIGESHNPETHLIPLVLDTALGKREKVYVFGDDYDTPDGTCIRDYIHVNDLAQAHLQAITYLNDGNDSTIINLGTGSGNSVLEIIKKSERITGKKINYEITGRRAGDPAILVADNKKAKKLLNWHPVYSIEKIIETAWKWSINPKY
ncbi:MAG: UDP-glucose 4-epimerase GalE [Bacteroidota bacterium]